MNLLPQLHDTYCGPRISWLVICEADPTAVPLEVRRHVPAHDEPDIRHDAGHVRGADHRARVGGHDAILKATGHAQEIHRGIHGGAEEEHREEQEQRRARHGQAISPISHFHSTPLDDTTRDLGRKKAKHESEAAARLPRRKKLTSLAKRHETINSKETHET